MLTFRQWLNEKREKTEHEPTLRRHASDARSSFYGSVEKRPENSIAKGGDCGYVSDHVLSKIQKHYPKAKTVDGTYHHENGNIVDHSWIEIPEIKHFIDPTHDQMHYYHKSKESTHRTKGGLYPDNAIKIGKTSTRKYKRTYRKFT